MEVGADGRVSQKVITGPLYYSDTFGLIWLNTMFVFALFTEYTSKKWIQRN